VDWDSSGLERQIGDAGIGSACRLLGRQADMMQVYSCLDIVVTSSSGYGFPRVVGEAMACGVPAVVMDEGDSALMGETSKAIPPANPEALARACLDLIEIGPAGRSLVGALARRRVEQRFSLTAMVQRYQALYASAATGEQVNSLRSRHAGAT
jgi:glycosyltransferase involved in cell wall biosynthesis